MSEDAAVDYLLALFASALPNVQVVDGEFGSYVADEFVQVLEVVGNETQVEMGGRLNDDYSIRCMARTYTGASDLAGRRERVRAMYDAIRTQVLADRSLGGAVLNAYPSRTAKRWGVTDKGGSAAELDFEIVIRTLV